METYVFYEHIVIENTLIIQGNQIIGMVKRSVKARPIPGDGIWNYVSLCGYSDWADHQYKDVTSCTSFDSQYPIQTFPTTYAGGPGQSLTLTNPQGTVTYFSPWVERQ